MDKKEMKTYTEVVNKLALAELHDYYGGGDGTFCGAWRELIKFIFNVSDKKLDKDISVVKEILRPTLFKK